MRREFEDEEPYVIVEKSGGGVMPFIIGAALGAGLALLFAPRSGAATRQRIKRRAVKAAHSAQHKVEEVASDVREKVEEKIDDAREAFEHKKEQVKLAIEAGRTAARETRSDLEIRLAEGKAAYRSPSARPAKRSTRRTTDDLS